MNKFAIVMFDLDGTLVDSYRFHIMAFHRFLMHFGVQPSIEEVRGLVGTGIDNIFRNTLPQEKRWTAIKKLPSFYRNEIDELLDEVVVVPGAIETLRLIRDMGYKTALITNSEGELVERILTGKGMKGLFDHIDPWSAELPEKEQRCRQVLDDLGLMPSQTLYVGDHSYDVQLAKKMGFVSCLVYNRVSWLYPHREVASALSPDLIISDIQEVADWLRQNR